MTAAVLSGMLVLGLAGCTQPEPAEPTPTPAFSSDEEAFAAAEKTYRAYVDALNARHANAAATPPPTDFLIGQALESELETQRVLAEQKRSIVGDAKMTRFAGTDFANDLGAVTAVACLDVSSSRVVDSEGTDVTPSDRPPVLALELVFVPIGAGLAVSESAVADDQTC